MPVVGEASILVKADATALYASFARIRSAATTFTSQVGRSVASVGQTFMTLVNRMTSLRGVLIGAAAGIAGGAIVKATLEQERADQAVAASLKYVGDSSAIAAAGVSNFASAVQFATNIGDEAVQNAFALGQQLTRLGTREMKDVTLAAVGLAQIIGSDLNTAMQLLAKAANGNFASLGRYGLKVTEGASNTEKFNEILSRSLDAFGIAQTKATGAAGAYDRFKNSVDDLVQSFGQLVAGKSGVTSALNVISDTLVGLTRVTQDFGRESQDVFAGLKATVYNTALYSGLLAPFAVAADRMMEIRRLLEQAGAQERATNAARAAEDLRQAQRRAKAGGIAAGGGVGPAGAAATGAIGTPSGRPIQDFAADRARAEAAALRAAGRNTEADLIEDRAQASERIGNIQKEMTAAVEQFTRDFNSASGPMSGLIKGELTVQFQRATENAQRALEAEQRRAEIQERRIKLEGQIGELEQKRDDERMQAVAVTGRALTAGELKFGAMVGGTAGGDERKQTEKLTAIESHLRELKDKLRAGFV